MTTNQYKTGVLSIISRIKIYNPEIGQYISHSLAPDQEFLIQLTNGTLKMPPEAAHNQEVFPGHVPEAWIVEIERSFIKSLVQLQVPVPKSSWKVIFSFLT
jgi:hypothetical protein